MLRQVYNETDDWWCQAAGWTDWSSVQNYDAVKCVVRGAGEERCAAGGAGWDRTSVTLHSPRAAVMESDNLQSSLPPIQDIVKEGWLMKRGEVIKNWRPR